MAHGIVHDFGEDFTDEVNGPPRLDWIRARMGKAMRGSDAILNASATLGGGIPQRPGIYFLIWDDLIVYVGQSYDIHWRVTQHAEEKRYIDRFACICGIPKWWQDEIEHAYIHAWNPPWNVERKRSGQLHKMPDLRNLAESLDRSRVMPAHLAKVASGPRLLWPEWRLQILGRLQHLSPGSNILLTNWE